MRMLAFVLSNSCNAAGSTDNRCGRKRVSNSVPIFQLYDDNGIIIDLNQFVALFILVDRKSYI